MTVDDLRAMRETSRALGGGVPDLRAAAATYLATFSGKPMAAEPVALDAFLRRIERLAIEGAAAIPEIDAAGMGTARRATDLAVEDGVAVIPVTGMLLKRPPWWARWYGATGYEDIVAQATLALDAPDVRAVLLWIDSPGGEVAGMFETADVLATLAARKPVVALADEIATSAAYMLASPAGTILGTSTAWLGSIGVIGTHVEVSKADKLAGYTYTVMFAGARKADGHPHMPLSPEARAGMQGTIDRLFDRFVEAVSRARPVLTADAVRALEAGTFQGADAVPVNLADGVSTFDETFAALKTAGTPGKGGTTMSVTTGKGGALTPPATKPAATSAEGQQTQDGDKGAETTAGTEDKGGEQQQTTDEPSAALPTNVVDFRAALDREAKRASDAALAQERERAQRIEGLCRLAERPDLAGHFIAKGHGVAAVERELTNLRAGNPSDDIRALVPPPGKHAGSEGPKRTESTKATFERLNAALAGQQSAAK